MSLRRSKGGLGLGLGLGLIWLAAVGACAGDSAGSEASETSSDPTGDGDGDPSTGDGDGDTIDCMTSASGLGLELYGVEQECTVVVRVSHDTLEVLGWQKACGPYATIDEAGARSLAEGLASVSADAVVLEPDPEAMWLLWDDPSVDPGGSAAVSNRNGLAVFAGTSVPADGSGEIVYPSTWRPGYELASECPPWGVVKFAGWDLVDGGAIEASELEEVLDVIEQTALVSAMQSYGGQLRDTQVLRYPRTVAPFAGEAGEWILALNGGVGTITGDGDGDPTGDGDGDDPCATSLIGDPLPGATVFADRCTSNGCHGSDGNSGNAVALATVVPDLSDAEIIESLLCFHSLGLTEQEAADVLAYLRENF